MKALRLFHLYLGLVLAIPLLLLVLSGVGLVFTEAIWRLQYPALGEPVPELDAADHGTALEAIEMAFEPDVTLVKWPQPGVAAYQVWLADGSEAFVAPVTHQVIDRWRWYERPMALLAETHIHLLAGETGKTVAGYVGLATLILSVVGIVVWWPRRRGFRWKTLLPASLHPIHLLAFHRNLGLVSAPLAIAIIGAGVGVAFFQPARVLLNGMFGDDTGAPLSQPPRVEIETETRAPMNSLVQQAESVFPDSSLVFYYPEKSDSGIITVRKRAPSEMHPNGLSFVYLDASDAKILKTIDASEAQPGDRVANSLYPIHSGKWGGVPYKLVVILNGVLVGSLLISGVTTYFRRG